MSSTDVVSSSNKAAIARQDGPLIRDDRSPLNLSTNFVRLDLDLALHRFFTFPADFTKRTGLNREFLSDTGFYLSADGQTIFCQFCNYKITSYEDWKNLNSAEDYDNKHRESSPTCDLFNKETQNLPLEQNDCINFRFESIRLFSLLKANWTSTMSVYDLARSAFYFAGEEDKCRCIFCKLEVRGWEPGDSANQEHKRWNTKCPFICGTQLGNVNIGDELAPSSSGNALGVQQINPFLKSFDYSKYPKLNVFSRRYSLEALGVRDLIPPKNPSYASIHSRIKSFKNWPKSMTQRPEDLAAAGLYYTGIGDRVCCFQCGLGLKDWDSSDDPFVEHITWSSTCQYLMMKKGIKFIQKVMEKASLVPELLCEGAENVENTKRGYLCKKCKKADANIVYLSCGHMVNCTGCADENRNCSTCNNKILAKLQVFLN
ncbi:baculoviral IAP repeat-containing protein 3-like [Neocloeon triangulifer]|uniref:baculoviral IAP repeat-containing protein 3-like n=1 Tax=Neocloeon triangulifer TaxID=2078957 RepID=UPI00286EFEFB|nr:baculoviral IAP repeat-containing protein 3-like [Neocloeon triangulifer]XP_059483621.1 baculoviral IAP repeat-containing protein 3-like [Neocloeon triangulifer]XP_059483623.1 baculoviral IAP repeat-containing protein 3-like [Neocloeon triangulifer]